MQNVNIDRGVYTVSSGQTLDISLGAESMLLAVYIDYYIRGANGGVPATECGQFKVVNLKNNTATIMNATEGNSGVVCTAKTASITQNTLTLHLENKTDTQFDAYMDMVFVYA